ncbi:P-loop NTPase fold protein [Streptomyces sp. NPDC005356]|uniref:P-loop NTPase fold protein n=1 Tax=Streptomyces sp. NPDC005356 TaxID=3157167 RepID=UPI0033A500EE
MDDARFFNDEPFLDQEEGPDLLGHEQYGQHAVKLLQRVRAQTETGVLALIGPWGSGKSTVLGKVIRQLRAQGISRDAWLVAELNPWLYSDLESLTVALFSEIRAALPKEEQWSEARQKIGGFGQAISPLGKLTALAGLDSESLIKAISDRVSGDTSASAAKRKAEDALRKAGSPVLVVMDDLDRLTPDELLLVFKLVRLVGHLPNVYYLISFDEQTLLDVLRRSDLVGDSEPRAREFLEKIVQVRLDLPAFRERDADVLVDRSLTAVLHSHELTMTPAEQQRFSEAYFQHLQGRLRTPRAIKRFFGQVDATLGSLAGNVDLVDFLLVTFLRTSEPGAYRVLSRHRAELTGTSFDPLARRDEQPGQRADRWRTRLRDAGVAEEHLQSVLGLMGMLFAPVRQSLGNGGDTQAIGLRRGVGNIDYFDRYMVFGVPNDDLPETAFELGLQHLADDVPSTEKDELLLRLRDDTHRIVRRISYRRVNGAPTPTAPLLAVIAQQYGQLNADAEQLGILTPERSLEFLAGDLLTDLAASERPTTLKDMANTPDGAVLASRTLHRASARTGSEPQPEAQSTPCWVREARSLVGHQIAQHLAPAASRPVESLTELELTLLWGWHHTDPASARAWITQRLDDTWAPLELLTALLPPGQAPFPGIEDTAMQGLDVLIGLEELYSRLGSLLDNPTTHRTDPHDEHQERILQALREHRQRNSANTT